MLDTAMPSTRSQTIAFAVKAITHGVSGRQYYDSTMAFIDGPLPNYLRDLRRYRRVVGERNSKSLFFFFFYFRFLTAFLVELEWHLNHAILSVFLADFFAPVVLITYRTVIGCIVIDLISQLSRSSDIFPAPKYHAIDLSFSLTSIIDFGKGFVSRQYHHITSP